MTAADAAYLSALYVDKPRTAQARITAYPGRIRLWSAQANAPMGSVSESQLADSMAYILADPGAVADAAR